MGDSMFKLLVCIIAGLMAGCCAGCAGISSAMVISPLLIAFTGIPAYEAITIALVTDVFSSGSSAITFARNGNIQMEKCKQVILLAATGTAAGSFLSSFLSDSILGHGIIVCTVCMAVKFIFFPDMDFSGNLTVGRQTRIVCTGALVIGLCCGLFGAGGGMMFVVLL